VSKFFFLLIYLLISHSDLEKPLPAWRRRVVEISSQTCSGTVLRAMGFWWPRVTGLENYKRGQEMGAVSDQHPMALLNGF
jgi:hypothetical protein